MIDLELSEKDQEAIITLFDLNRKERLPYDQLRHTVACIALGPELANTTIWTCSFHWNTPEDGVDRTYSDQYGLTLMAKNRHIRTGQVHRKEA